MLEAVLREVSCRVIGEGKNNMFSMFIEYIGLD